MEILDEVVVIGYGQVKKNDMTGSVMAIKPDELSKGITTNARICYPERLPASALYQMTVHREVEHKSEFVAVPSLNASNDPLIVIDGLAIDNEGIKGMANGLSMVNLLILKPLR